MSVLDVLTKNHIGADYSTLERERAREREREREREVYSQSRSDWEEEGLL